MSHLVSMLDRILYPSFTNNWDDDLFRSKILTVVRNDDTILDLGAGAGILKQMNFKGIARRVHGLDPDERVLKNPFLDEAKVGFGEEIPYENETFDIVLSNNVMEHLKNPDTVFLEVKRVLKPGGHFLLKTPNKAHYVAAIASFTPAWFHQYVGKLKGRRDEDTFPTLYRANTPFALRRIAARTGFDLGRIDLVEGRPEYLRFCAPAYILGWFWERIVNKIQALKYFRVLIIADLIKIPVVKTK